MSTAPLEEVPRARWLVVALILVLATVGVVLVDRAGGDAAGEPAPMLQVAPGGQVALSSLPDDHQALYLAASDDPTAFEQVACYCGCEAFLDHRHLLDCFVRPDGGWERHATGCGICLAEAREVVEMRADQVPIDEIARRIDDAYGAILVPSAA